MMAISSPRELVPLGRLLVPASAIDLLIELESRGFDLRVVDDARLRVTPSQRLTLQDRESIRAHRDYLKLLVAFCEGQR